jgi:hypothetical protein
MTLRHVLSLTESPPIIHPHKNTHRVRDYFPFLSLWPFLILSSNLLMSSSPLLPRLYFILRLFLLPSHFTLILISPSLPLYSLFATSILISSVFFSFYFISIFSNFPRSLNSPLPLYLYCFLPHSLVAPFHYPSICPYWLVPFS